MGSLAGYPGKGARYTSEELRKLLDREAWEDASEHDTSYGEVRRIWLGTVFGVTPSGKVYAPFACSNVAGCDTCKGTGAIPNFKRRVVKKRTSKYNRDRRHYMNIARQRVFVHRARRDAAHAKHMRILMNVNKATRPCTACGSLGSREAHLDERWNEYMEALCESIGASFEWGEESAFVVEYRDKPEEDDDVSSEAD